MLPAETRILLIEDSQVMARQTISVFHSMGYKNITEARNGFEAIQRLIEARDAKIEYGLFVIDWEMPKLNGLEFFQMIKGIPAWAAVPAIFLTSHNSLDNVITAAGAGIVHFLIKPATKEQFEKKLKAISKDDLAKNIDQLLMNSPRKDQK